VQPLVQSHLLRAEIPSRAEIHSRTPRGTANAGARRLCRHAMPKAGLLWAGVTRNTSVLAECGEDSHAGAVLELAHQLLRKPVTAGWGFAQAPGLKAVKFHVHDVHEHSSSIVWTIACVHDAIFDDILAKGFLEKITLLTEPLRRTPEWRNGRALCAQLSFSPVLQQRLEQANSMGRTAMVSPEVNEVGVLMSMNIELMLRRARGEDLKAVAAVHALQDAGKSHSQLLSEVAGRQLLQHGLKRAASGTCSSQGSSPTHVCGI